ncbi:protein of unknown function [Candidatus Nitrosocosmicus franklandus]|uniref:Uncharacterized protein n=1 Tax=Candidatus Nitrosocosmicus franklandianus TaxID=1798806 RepID=A0A484ICC2_9ARCH|nr:protein of unknown function [Candidatus Nitrosocosmicus franklandus]
MLIRYEVRLRKRTTFYQIHSKRQLLDYADSKRNTEKSILIKNELVIILAMLLLNI